MASVDVDVHAFDVLGDPVRRRLLELLGDGERTAGELTAVVRDEFGISQPAVSRHLRVLRETGFATSTTRGQQHVYRLRAQPLAEVDAWLARYRSLWSRRLDALDTEIAPGGSSGRRRTKEQS
jgi:DNA-binding transcriptional ArsR family regulator